MANEDQDPQSASVFRPEITRRLPELPGNPMRGAQPAEPSDSGKKLVVGQDIVLNGQITACDQLVVQGRVEAALENSQSIEISETGYFKGSAVIEEATISGHFEGNLTVRGELTVKSKGRIEGEVRYGKLCVESGGQIIGTVEALSAGGMGAASATPAARQTGGDDN